jgi:hypothetical protein
MLTHTSLRPVVWKKVAPGTLLQAIFQWRQSPLCHDCKVESSKCGPWWRLRLVWLLYIYLYSTSCRAFLSSLPNSLIAPSTTHTLVFPSQSTLIAFGLLLKRPIRVLYLVIGMLIFSNTFRFYIAISSPSGVIPWAQFRFIFLPLTRSILRLMLSVCPDPYFQIPIFMLYVYGCIYSKCPMVIASRFTFGQYLPIFVSPIRPQSH